MEIRVHGLVQRASPRPSPRRAHWPVPTGAWTAGGGGVCGKDQLPRENGHQPVMMRAEVSDWPSYLATRRGDCGAPGENSVSRVLDVEPGEE